MQTLLFSLLCASTLLGGPYTEGVDLYLDSNLPQVNFAAQLDSYDSASKQGDIEGKERLLQSKAINIGKFERFEFTMPKNSSSPELHNVKITIAAQLRDGSVIGSCSFKFQVALNWSGLGFTREVRLNNHQDTATGPVSCGMYQDEEVYARGKKIPLPKLAFVINKGV